LVDPLGDPTILIELIAGENSAWSGAMWTYWSGQQGARRRILAIDPLERGEEVSLRQTPGWRLARRHPNQAELALGLWAVASGRCALVD
jgi:hypothetical protein